MPCTLLVPAAQYLRMSTDQQQYSLESQAEAIQRYAKSHGLAVVQTYADGAKSGLSIKNRSGLARLLQDVVSGESTYNAVLVYDISRWGRFQDSDEAAHYEFLCKSAGVPVHYCAEQFPNDSTLSAAILKAVKRTMAGEYSRELSVKCFEGQKRVAQLGYRVGGIAGYGLRRMMVSADRRRNRVLKAGEYKNLKKDRIVLVPGPVGEVETVREIYRMFIGGRKTTVAIAEELNRRGLTYGGRTWKREAVWNILTNKKYIGTNVWGRTAVKLKGPTVQVPKAQWTTKAGAFKPIIDQSTFERAQQVIASDTHKLSDEQVLDSLRTLLRRKGALSENIIEQSDAVPALATLHRRFGPLRKIYELLGYERPRGDFFFRIVEMRRRTQKMRDQLIERLLRIFPGKLSVIRVGRVRRPVLRLKSGLRVSVLLCPPYRTPYRQHCWRVWPIHAERSMVILLCRMNKKRDGFLDMHIMPGIVSRPVSFRLKRNDVWLKQGQRLRKLSEFCKIAENVRALQL
jgi:DNA invertase Pin-like site-specific DNA recombinase